MFKLIAMLAPAVGLGALALGAVRGRAAEAAGKGLEFVRLDLPDGDRWVLGEGAVGRPFLARLVLANAGTRPIKLWEPTDAEGAACPKVVLTDARGHETVLRPRPVPRAAGVPGARTLAPGATLDIELELLRVVDEDAPPPPGDYTIRASYANTLAAAFVIDGVWTGSIASESHRIRIVPPGARKPKR
ncbi:MAG TPA: hypothetical protein VG406_03940 [Isosphaeraceae bacterium]|jgi:hypothetical protein|nr:hypothetical protein [Isosphaeraceae bacterium]